MPTFVYKHKYIRLLPSSEEIETTLNTSVALIFIFLAGVVIPIITAGSKGKFGIRSIYKKKDATLSTALFFSDKYALGLILFIYLIMTPFMLYNKNFFTLDPLRIVISIFIISIPLLFGILTIYGPENKNHWVFSIPLFVVATFTYMLIYFEYYKYFEDNIFLGMMLSVEIVICIFSFLILSLLSYFWITNTIRNSLFYDIFGFFEYCNVLLFGLGLIIFSLYPKLPLD